MYYVLILEHHTVNQFGANNKNKKIKIIVFSILPLLSPNVFKNFYNNKKNDITIKSKNFIYIKSYFELIKILNKFNKKLYFYNAANLSLTSTLIELFLINFKKFKKIQIIGEISPSPKNQFLKNFYIFIKSIKFLIKKILFLFFYKLSRNIFKYDHF